ncbi:MAG: DUF4358 domain-containing protein [Firmicutes bacterium]|nr:DUF4358 domain-containing protein [[Eubacterium] siraeum]MCM1486893.1 DUF4358 domain-containing protein [Bacillota bacterium]
MKRLLSIFMTAAIFLLSGCGSSEGNNTDKTAEQLMEVVLNSVQFPQMIDLDDDERIEEMGIDLSLAEDHAVSQQMLSVDVCEVIIIKAEQDNIPRILDSLETRRESLINDFAFYPEQVESAEATVVGSEKDVAYLICHAEADTAEEKLLAELK